MARPLPRRARRRTCLRGAAAIHLRSPHHSRPERLRVERLGFRIQGRTAMNRTEQYRHRLRDREEWEPYLLSESGLPGPRGNLELLQAVADEGGADKVLRLLESTPERAPSGSREEFLAACGAAGLGESIARGEENLWPRLRPLASDPRWRVRLRAGERGSDFASSQSPRRSSRSSSAPSAATAASRRDRWPARGGARPPGSCGGDSPPERPANTTSRERQ
jgi:hypothetical protein